MQGVQAEGSNHMRFDRQIQMPQIGEQGQQRLAEASVTVIGAGGIGSPALTYLACAGVGHIRVVDSEAVNEADLNRQFLYGAGALGKSKAHAACARLGADYPDLVFEPVAERITAQEAARLIGRPQVIVDCVDTIEARLAVNAYAMRAGLPLVEGGVAGFGGFVMAIDSASPCLECVMPPVKLKERESPVLGAAAGVIGSLEAIECVKILLGIGRPLYGKMLKYDGLRCRFTLIDLHINERCTQPHTGACDAAPTRA